MFYITLRGCCLEHQGDLVSRLIRGRTRITIGAIEVTNLLTLYPKPSIIS